MKAKGSPTFFEVLRTTFNDQKLEPAYRGAQAPTQTEVQTLTPPPVTPTPTPEPPPAPLASAPTPSDMMPIVLIPEPEPPVMTPAPTPEPSPAQEKKFDPDTKFFRVSFTNAVFAGIVAVIVLLSTFYVGVRVGRSGSAPAAAWAVKTAEWAYKDAAEQREAERASAYFKQRFEEMSLKNVRVTAEPGKYTLWCGQFADPAEAQKTLDEVRRFKYSSPSGIREIFKGAELKKLE